LNFFRAQPARARRLKSACDELRVKLTKDDAESDTQQVPESALKQLSSADMSAYFNGGVFNAIQLISKCNPESHKSVVDDVWHPARLCLDETEVGIRVFASFSTETGDWQEFCVRTCVKLSLQCSFNYMYANSRSKAVNQKVPVMIIGPF
jgi:3-methyladenine DNA glycosylase AlkC